GGDVDADDGVPLVGRGGDLTDRRDVGQRGDLGGPLLGGGDVGVRDDTDGWRRGRRVALTEHRDELTLVGAGGDEVGRGVAQLEPEHRGGEHPEQGDGAGDDDPRASVHRPGEPGEHAVLGGDVAEPAEQPVQPRHAGDERGTLQAAAEEDEQRGHERERRGQRDDHHRDPGRPEGPQDVGGEDHERADRDRDGHGGEGHRTPRGHHGAPHGLLDHRPAVAPAPTPAQRQPPARGGGDDVGHLLAVSGDDEEPVVDRQAQPEHGDDVDDDGVQLDDLGEPEQYTEPTGDRGERADEGHARGEEAAEDHDHDEQRQRQRDRLAAGQVGLDLVGDRRDDERDAGDDPVRLGRDVGQLTRHGGEPLLHGGARGPTVVELRVELGDEEEAVALCRDKRLDERVRRPLGGEERVDDAGDTLEVVDL